MSLMLQASRGSRPVRWLAQWWRDRLKSGSPAERENRHTTDSAHITDDPAAGCSGPWVHAGKWPDQVLLLLRRMRDDGLDPLEIAQTKPQTIRALQHHCSLCTSARRCKRDLDRDPSNPVWQDYCENTERLKALRAERAKSNPGRFK